MKQLRSIVLIDMQMKELTEVDAASLMYLTSLLIWHCIDYAHDEAMHVLCIGVRV